MSSVLVLIGNEPARQSARMRWALRDSALRDLRIFPLCLFRSEAPPSESKLKLLERISDARALGNLEEFSDPKSAAPLLLERLTRINPALADLLPGDGEPWSRFVLPREGFVSPWSSQAGLIALCVGLGIARLEYAVFYHARLDEKLLPAQLPGEEIFYDPMIEQCAASLAPARELLCAGYVPGSDEKVRADSGHIGELNQRWGLSLSREDIDHLARIGGQRDERELHASELMMYAQINSEHCRHKLFNAEWYLAGKRQPDSLFSMIRRTHAHSPSNTLEAYHDNAAVLSGCVVERWLVGDNGAGRQWLRRKEDTHYCIKVESHNHPTAVLPFAGAATGAGGEIRDESATGRGAQPIGGFSGFIVSDLLIPDARRPWETDPGCPGRIHNAFSIMLDAPVGAARCNNEFGRPSLAGFFRTLTCPVAGRAPESTARAAGERDDGTGGGAAPGDTGKSFYGFHKPVMLAGGYALMRAVHQKKQALSPGAHIIVLGGPAMLLGLGGGSLSSQASQSGGSEDEGRKARLDFASVQRSNPEVQRRCHEVLRLCIAQGAENPLRSIHDVGAGGLSNAVSEIVGQAGRGARVSLAGVSRLNQAMTPMEIWCNEAQERYVLVIDPVDLERFKAICQRERCPYDLIGEVTGEPRIRVSDDRGSVVVDMALADLLEPHKRRVDISAAILARRDESRARLRARDAPPRSVNVAEFDEAVRDVLRLPAVGNKRFLVTIGDRSVGGLTCRDQMVGPWQEPVADVAVSRFSMDSYEGIAMAVGERATMAVVDPLAASRMAFCEALTNLLAAEVSSLDNVRLSANWMVSSGFEADDVELFDAVKSVCADLAIPLDISIPVGKDSVTMRTVWQSADGGGSVEVKSPLTLVITAFSRVRDVRRTLTPYLPGGELVLLHLPVTPGYCRLGGSALAYVRPQWFDGQSCTPDVGGAGDIRRWFEALRAVRPYCLACHDVSDGGLLTSLVEMALCSRRGLRIDVADGAGFLPALFSEEAAIVVAVRARDLPAVRGLLDGAGQNFEPVARTNGKSELSVHGTQGLWSKPLSAVWEWWTETSYRMQSWRDDPACARSEREQGVDSFEHRLGLEVHRSFVVNRAAPALARPGERGYSATGGSAPRPARFETSHSSPDLFRPAVAILREQGCNGHQEMAYAFDQAGFDACDVCMQDLVDDPHRLEDFQVLAACGGFSYADVLGAGRGWAAAVLHSPPLHKAFGEFFMRDDTLSLGVCNGCQFLSQLKELIPGAGDWPSFKPNLSRQYESRLVMVSVETSNSVWVRGMEGSRLPIIVAHGEGRVDRPCPPAQVALRYIDPRGNATEVYPHNPNGSEQGIAALNSADGRVLISMPHPERLTTPEQFSWLPPGEQEQPSPWLQLFHNACRFIQGRRTAREL